MQQGIFINVFIVCILLFYLYFVNASGDRGGTVVKALCYKSEGRWFDPSCCHWNFSST